MQAFFALHIYNLLLMNAPLLTLFLLLFCSYLPSLAQNQEHIYIDDPFAQFSGGNEARLKFIYEHLIYPQEAKEKGIEGVVIVKFKVDTNGIISNIETIKGIGGGCDQESERIVSIMPNWEPAKLSNGKAVEAWMNMPIKFSLKIVNNREFLEHNINIDSLINSTDLHSISLVLDSTSEEVAIDTITYITHPSAPSFPGGGTQMIDFIMKNIAYPDEAIKEGIQGTIYVKFYVDSLGLISNIEVIRGIGGGCDKEIIRVVKKMPRWEPALKFGKPIGSWCSIAVKLTLQN